MGFWKSPPKPILQHKPTPRPEPDRYVCNNDQCDPLSLTGEVANRLAYGCFMCSPPTRYVDLPKETQSRIPTGNLSLLWQESVLCPQHNRPLRPFCPDDYSLIDRDGNIPPVGMWGFASAGKTVFCAALMMEFNRLFSLTGIIKDSLFDQGEYEKEVVAPLKNRGSVPEKTYGHRSISLKLYRPGWFRMKVTLNDMGGENFKQWFDAKPDEPEKRIMLDHMLRAREAIFLMSPESAEGIGATVPPDPFPIIQRVMQILHEQGWLSSFNRRQLEDLLERIMDVLSRFQYLFIGGGNSFRLVADEIAAMVGQADNEDLVSRLDEGIMKIVEQMTPISLEDQLGGLVLFLERWGSRGPDNKLDLRLAITIGKADLLQGSSLKDSDLAGPSAAPRGMQGWGDAVSQINRLNEASNKRDWHDSLRRMSNAARQVLLDFGEGQFIKKAEENFREVGFFFVSSLGRDTEPFIQWDAAAPAQPMGEGMMAAFADAVTTPAKMPTHQRPQWRVDKRVRISRGGHRRPEPQNVLWPLLWILTA